MNMNQMKEPCENCILLPMCLNKNPEKLIDECNLLVNYMIGTLDIEKDKIYFCEVKSLRTSFSISDSAYGKFIGIIGISTVNTDGMLKDETLSSEYSLGYKVEYKVE